MTADAGDWIIVASVLLMLASTGAIAVSIARAGSRPGPLALLSAALTIISLVSAYTAGYFTDHHDEIDWLSSRVIGIVFLLTFLTFVYGLIGSAISAQRAARRRELTIAVFSPWIVYAVILAVGVYATIRAI